MSSLSSKQIQSGSLLAIGLSLLIGSFVSYGLFISKQCTDTSASANFQKCNYVHIIVAISLIALAVSVYLGHVELTEKQLVMIALGTSIVLFISGLVQLSTLNMNVICDSTTLATLNNFNKLVLVVAMMTLVLSGYMYYKIHTDESNLLNFRYYLRK